MKKLLYLIAMLTLQASAQIDSLQLWKKYDKEVIYFSGSKYIKNNQVYGTKTLKTEFDYSPLGKGLFKMYQKDRKFFFVFYGLGFVSYTYALINLFDRKFDNATTFLAGSLVCWGGSFTFSISADKKLKKAVWYRNRDMLFR